MRDVPMRKKTIFILSIIVIAILVWGIRVYSLNAGVAKKYEIETFDISDTFQIDNSNVKVISFEYGEIDTENDFPSIPVTIEIEVTNTSNEAISVRKLVESKLAYGMDYYQTMDVIMDREQVRNLPPNTTTKITLIFPVNPKYKGENAALYLDQSLYANKVSDKFKDGKRYGIAVNLE
jgi:hypothetical protein